MRKTIQGLCVLMAFGMANTALAQTTPGAPDIVRALRSATMFHAVQSALATLIATGPIDITLGGTHLSEIQAQLGGTVRHGSDASAPSDWLCYDVAVVTARPSRIWFISEGGSDGAVSLVAAEISPGTEDPYECDPASRTLTRLEFGAPNLDGTLRPLMTRFGWAKPNAQGQVTYRHESPADAASGAITRQTLIYQFEYGQITGVAIGESKPD